MTEIIKCEVMTSREIAELTGKEHSNVMRDIRSLLEQGVNQINFELVEYSDKKGEKRPMYQLTKKGCLILASGYNVILRAKIINRWEELETKERQNVPALPQTYLEALEALVQSEKALTDPDFLIQLASIREQRCYSSKKSDETKKKISQSLIGHSVSNETRKKLSEKLKGREMPKDKTLIGLKCGRLTIIEEVERKIKPCGQKERMVKCKCDCGKETIVRLRSFIKGRTKSCGCLQSDAFRKITTKHGLSLDKLNKLYRAIKRRCYNKNCPDYKNYGGRGIKMCDEWRNDFMSFYNWSISNGYDYNKGIKEQSIDRIDVDGDYEPSNCRFVNAIIQARNRRFTHKYEYKGMMLDLKTISEKSGIQYNTLWQRINKYGYTLKQSLEKF